MYLINHISAETLTNWLDNKYGIKTNDFILQFKHFFETDNFVFI